MNAQLQLHFGWRIFRRTGRFLQNRLHINLHYKSHSRHHAIEERVVKRSLYRWDKWNRDFSSSKCIPINGGKEGMRENAFTTDEHNTVVLHAKLVWTQPSTHHRNSPILPLRIPFKETKDERTSIHRDTSDARSNRGTHDIVQRLLHYNLLRLLRDANDLGRGDSPSNTHTAECPEPTSQ